MAGYSSTLGRAAAVANPYKPFYRDFLESLAFAAVFDSRNSTVSHTILAVFPSDRHVRVFIYMDIPPDRRKCVRGYPIPRCDEFLHRTLPGVPAFPSGAYELQRIEPDRGSRGPSGQGKVFQTVKQMRTGFIRQFQRIYKKGVREYHFEEWKDR